MKLSPPFLISSRLLPAIKVEDCTISIEPTGDTGEYGKPQWRYYLDFDNGKEWSEEELYGWGDTQEIMESILCFMSACGESYNYALSCGMALHETENAELFPDWIAEWCGQNSNELSIMEFDISREENKDNILIEE